MFFLAFRSEVQQSASSHQLLNYMCREVAISTWGTSWTGCTLAVLPLQQTPGWSSLPCEPEPAILKFLTVFWRRPHLILDHAVCSITMLPILVCLLILSHKAVPLALCHRIWGPFCMCHALTCACASLPTAAGTRSLLLLWLQFSPERDGRNFWPKASFPHHWPCHPFLLFLHHFPSSRLTCGFLGLQLSFACISSHLFVAFLLSVLATVICCPVPAFTSTNICFWFLSQCSSDSSTTFQVGHSLQIQMAP